MNPLSELSLLASIRDGFVPGKFRDAPSQTAVFLGENHSTSYDTQSRNYAQMMRADWNAVRISSRRAESRDRDTDPR